MHSAAPLKKRSAILAQIYGWLRHDQVRDEICRKEPKECHDVVDDIPSRGQSFNYLPVDVMANKEEELPSVSEKYLRTSEYTLLYSRNKEPFGSEYRCAFSTPFET